jgi:hypothetical protein
MTQDQVARNWVEDWPKDWPQRSLFYREGFQVGYNYSGETIEQHLLDAGWDAWEAGFYHGRSVACLEKKKK